DAAAEDDVGPRPLARERIGPEPVGGAHLPVKREERFALRRGRCAAERVPDARPDREAPDGAIVAGEDARGRNGDPARDLVPRHRVGDTEVVLARVVEAVVTRRTVAGVGAAGEDEKILLDREADPVLLGRRLLFGTG